jgi:hypothetical protein
MEGTSAGARPSKSSSLEGLRAKGRDAARAALQERPLAIAELGVMGVLLSVVALVVLGSFYTRGGFITDDWVVASWTRYPPHGGITGTLDAFSSIKYRPGQYLYQPLIHTLLGLHMRAFLVWASVCAIALSLAFYAFLRVLSARPLEAGAAATLLLVFPYSSSTRLWATACVVSIAITLYLIGSLVVMRALARPVSRRSLVLHACGVILILAGVMTYEIVAPAALLSVLLYLRVTSRRRAIIAWLVDVVLVGSTLIFVTAGRGQPVGSVSAELTHVRIIWDQGLVLWSQVLVPYGSTPSRVALGALLAVALVAGCVALALPRTSATRRDLVRWLGFLTLGAFAVAIGYAMFVPADPYYSPESLGIGDRTNGLAALGWVLVIVSLARLLATLAFRDLRRATAWVAVAVIAACALVGLGYSDRLRTEADAYAASFHEQARILGVMKSTLPHPKHGSTIYLVRQVPWAALGVPVFVQAWELLGTVKITYDDPTLSGYPIVAPTVTLICARTEVHPSLAAFGPPVRYGNVYVLDMGLQQTIAIHDQKTCQRVVSTAGVATPPPAGG